MKEIKEFYTPMDVAKKLHTSPVTVRVSLRNRCEGWDFPYIECGKRIKIPVKTFDEFYNKHFGDKPDMVTA